MARRKRTSPVLEKAVRRMAGMNSIDPNLNVGEGLTLPSFSTLIETMRLRRMPITVRSPAWINSIEKC